MDFLNILTSLFFLIVLGHYLSRFIPRKIKILAGDKLQIIKYRPAFFGKDTEIRSLLEKEGLQVAKYDIDTKTYIVKVHCSECLQMKTEAFAINAGKFICKDCGVQLKPNPEFTPETPEEILDEIKVVKPVTRAVKKPKSK